MGARRSRAPAAAAVALPLLLLAAAAPRRAAAQSLIAFGAADCVSPPINSLDGFTLNSDRFFISQLPSGFVDARSRADKVTALGAETFEGAQETYGDACDSSDTPFDTTAPNVMYSKGPDGKPVPLDLLLAPQKCTPGEASLGFAQTLNTRLAAASAATAAARAGASPAGSVTRAAVAPTTVSIGDLFSITYYGTWKVVTNLVANETYVLYQCGTPNPADSRPELKAFKMFQIPLHSLAVPDTTAIAFVGQSVLKLTDRVVGAPSYCTDPCGATIANKCGVRADPDPLQGFRVPQGILDASDAILRTSKSSDKKSITVSVTTIHPAIRVQWLKFVGAFFNREGYASNTADIRMRNYLSKKKLAQAYFPDPTTKPKVLWLAAMDTYVDWGYPQDGVQYLLFSARYKKIYVQDAGGVLLDAKQILMAGGKYPTSVVDIDTFSKGVKDTDPNAQYRNVAINPMGDAMKARQALLEIMAMADVIVDETYFVRPVGAPSLDALIARFAPSADSPAKITLVDVQNFPAFKNGKVVTVNKRLNADMTGTDWFETAMIETDRVLDDFISIITPQARQTQIATKYLMRLGQDSVYAVRASTCSSIKTCTRGAPGSVCANAYYNCRDGTLTYGTRNSHCNPQPRCKVRCNCCASPPDPTCASSTCARAPIATNCPA